ncbi:MAG TPA: VWA domain-containing protein [Pyrinomonadaceae bacterium]|jgi:VWFA-related protein|nr:VWA domain-containing protein [Pyrinomonadaceae bacterium]
MKFGIYSLAIVLALTVASSPQSGRRAPATPTPTPGTGATIEEPEQYSESNPGTRRYARPASPSQPIDPAVLAPVIGSSGSDDGEVVKVETNLVTIPVSVFDRNGLYIPGLRTEDFKIFEDGREQQIAYFGAQDKPFTVALLLDTSPSTQYKIDEIHRAAEAFIDQLGPNDSVIVIEFNSSVKIQTQRTTDRQKIYKGIQKAKFGDGTSLYNAVDEALRKQLSKIEGRKAVVLFTDGVDTTSRKNNYDGTVAYAEESDSLVFPIYFNTYADNRSMSGGGWPGIIFGGGISAGTSASDYAVGKKYLEELAEVTGGRVFRPESTPGGLTRAFEGIAEELRRQYNIGYVPDTEGKRGQRRMIKVRVNRPGLIIRSRDSYIVGAAISTTAPDLPKPK